MNYSIFECGVDVTSLMSTYTLTFGDVAENHVGNQQIGTLSQSGLSTDDLRQLRGFFIDAGFQTEFVNLSLDEDSQGYILIVKCGSKYFGLDPDDLLREQESLSYDTKVKMYGRVVSKHARHNICFDDVAQDPSYEEGKGTIIAYNSVPYLGKLRTGLSEMIDEPLKTEGNYYYDISKCGIGFHGDTERRIVVGLRLGATLPLVYKWFYRNQPVSDPIVLTLEHGDMYFMDEKATGHDWKYSSRFTLRHSAGCAKYTGI